MSAEGSYYLLGSATLILEAKLLFIDFNGLDNQFLTVNVLGD